MKKIYGYFDTEFGMFLFGLFILCIGLFSIAFFLDHSACTSRARGLGLESDWGPVQGCLVKVGNRYALSNISALLMTRKSSSVVTVNNQGTHPMTLKQVIAMNTMRRSAARLMGRVR